MMLPHFSFQVSSLLHFALNYLVDSHDTLLYFLYTLVVNSNHLCLINKTLIMSKSYQLHLLFPLHVKLCFSRLLTFNVARKYISPCFSREMFRHRRLCLLELSTVFLLKIHEIIKLTVQQSYSNKIFFQKSKYLNMKSWIEE